MGERARAARQDDDVWPGLAEVDADDDTFVPFARLGTALRVVFVTLQLASLPRRTATVDVGEEALQAAVELLRTAADRVVLPALARKHAPADRGARPPSAPVRAALEDAQHRLADGIRALVEVVNASRVADRIVLAVIALALKGFSDPTTSLGAASAKLLASVRGSVDVARRRRWAWPWELTVRFAGASERPRRLSPFRTMARTATTSWTRFSPRSAASSASPRRGRAGECSPCPFDLDRRYRR